ncbi:MAG: M28 family peptidase [Ruminococcus sp.]|nr:M28 family peptidase [Ruminococcus sp.]MDY3894871.1 M28 family peptidase [Candidatus Fimenecus sp.]
MKEENRKYAEEAFEIVEHAAKKIGSRLPGSDGEKEYAAYMGDKLRSIGIEPVREEFAVSPRASIGGIPYAGYLGLIMSALVYVALHLSAVWYGMALASVVCWVWLILSVFLYKTWFDMFFKQEISQNTYGELLPPDGKYDYTIILSGHTDTSWCWRHSAHASKFKNTKPAMGLVATFAKVGFGVVCFLFLTAVSIAMTVISSGVYFGEVWAIRTANSASFANFLFAMHFLPVVTAIGCMFIIMWADPNPRNASRGAMDNATGCALSFAVTKYFHDHPEKMPKNCRIIDFNCGSEEAGLRGSLAFTREHKGEPILENTWNINIDSVADKDFFEVVIKDDWQFCRFDTDLEKMFKDTFNELGIVSKTNGCIHNPVGGCDSTPMTKAGIKSVTFAAQDPTLTYYYHTWHDMPERFELETVGDGFDVLLGVIDKIDKFQQANGFNGPQK